MLLTVKVNPVAVAVAALTTGARAGPTGVVDTVVSESRDSPTEFVAEIVKSYLVPLVRPVTTQGEVVHNLVPVAHFSV